MDCDSDHRRTYDPQVERQDVQIGVRMRYHCRGGHHLSSTSVAQLLYNPEKQYVLHPFTHEKLETRVWRE